MRCTSLLYIRAKIHRSIDPAAAASHSLVSISQLNCHGHHARADRDRVQTSVFAIGTSFELYVVLVNEQAMQQCECVAVGRMREQPHALKRQSRIVGVDSGVDSWPSE